MFLFHTSYGIIQFPTLGILTLLLTEAISMPGCRSSIEIWVTNVARIVEVKIAFIILVVSHTVQIGIIFPHATVVVRVALPQNIKHIQVLAFTEDKETFFSLVFFLLNPNKELYRTWVITYYSSFENRWPFTTHSTNTIYHNLLDSTNPTLFMGLWWLFKNGHPILGERYE